MKSLISVIFLLEHKKSGQKNETSIVNFRKVKLFDSRSYFQQIHIFFRFSSGSEFKFEHIILLPQT